MINRISTGTNFGAKFSARAQEWIEKAEKEGFITPEEHENAEKNISTKNDEKSILKLFEFVYDNATQRYRRLPVIHIFNNNQQELDTYENHCIATSLFDINFRNDFVRNTLSDENKLKYVTQIVKSLARGCSFTEKILKREEALIRKTYTKKDILNENTINNSGEQL